MLPVPMMVAQLRYYNEKAKKQIAQQNKLNNSNTGVGSGNRKPGGM